MLYSYLIDPNKSETGRRIALFCLLIFCIVDHMLQPPQLFIIYLSTVFLIVRML